MCRHIRLTFALPFLAVAMTLLLLTSNAATAEAAEPSTGASTGTASPATWQQSSVSVWSNWNPAICNGAYRNATGDPRPPLSSREMHRILSAVLARLNDEIGGRLLLVDAGKGPAGRHCGETDLAGGIFVGWSPLEAGVAGMAPSATNGATITGAGVILNTLLVCQDTSEWIEFVMLHEMMHALGIAHSEVPDSVMSESADCDQTAILHEDDVEALSDLYPGRTARTAEAPVTSAAPAPAQTHFDATNAEVSPEQLIRRLAAGGCKPRLLAVSTSGRFQVYVVGAPAFVNAAFPTVLVAKTPFRYRCVE